MARLHAPNMRNKQQKLADQMAAWELRKEGKTYHEVAKLLGLSYTTVHSDLEEVTRIAAKALINDRKKAIEYLVSVTMTSIQDCELAWQRSLERAEKETIRQCIDGTEITKAKEGQSGNPGHKRNVLKGVEIVAKLLHLYDEEKSDGAQLTAIEKALAKNHELAEKELAAQKKKYKELKASNSDT